jgi:hypothetical protein
MSLFEDKNLVILSRIVEEPDCRGILEISFEGIHDQSDKQVRSGF